MCIVSLLQCQLHRVVLIQWHINAGMKTCWFGIIIWQRGAFIYKTSDVTVFQLITTSIHGLIIRVIDNVCTCRIPVNLSNFDRSLWCFGACEIFQPVPCIVLRFFGTDVRRSNGAVKIVIHGTFCSAACLQVLRYFMDFFVVVFNPLKGRGINWLHFVIQV